MTQPSFLVLVGNRHFGFNRAKLPLCNEIIKNILTDAVKRYGSDLNVVSISCDTAFGRCVRDYCFENGIRFCEFTVYFNGPRGRKEDYNAVYCARNSSLVDIGTEFHLVLGSRSRETGEVVVDLLNKVKVSVKPYVMYDETGTQIEFYWPE